MLHQEVMQIESDTAKKPPALRVILVSEGPEEREPIGWGRRQGSKRKEYVDTV